MFMPATAARGALLTAVAAALVVTACASGGVEGDDDGQTRARAGYATLVIENDNPSTVTVYALRAGSRQRIGTVTGLSTEQFAIRRNLMAPGGELRVMVDPVGSPRTYTAHPVIVNEGDVIEMTVSSFLR